MDETLLNRAQIEAVPCVRIYRWREPTLSLGYFQTYADREKHVASRHCACVRRLTGGGAILHDNEITYSIVLPVGHRLAADRDELYRAVHGCLIEALANFGATARLCEGGRSETADTEPFLCFQRRSPGDVMLGEHKICGSAQRRRSGAVLQHGSLLWRASPAAPELSGVDELAARQIPQDSMLECWLNGVARRLGFAWRRDELDESEAREARALAESRYRGEDWTRYRGRRPGAIRT